MADCKVGLFWDISVDVENVYFAVTLYEGNSCRAGVGGLGIKECLWNVFMTRLGRW